MLSAKNFIAIVALATAVSAVPWPFTKRVTECSADDKGPNMTFCDFNLTPTNPDGIESEKFVPSLQYALYVPFYDDDSPFLTNTVIGGFGEDDVTKNNDGTLKVDAKYCIPTNDPPKKVGEWLETWAGTTVHGPNIYGTDWAVNSVKCVQGQE